MAPSQFAHAWWGVAPGWVGHWTFNKGREKYAECLRQVAEARHSAREFLAYGTLEGEARLVDPLPPARCEWRRWNKDTRKFEVSGDDFPAVMGTLWKNADGTRSALAVANFTSGPVTTHLALPDGNVKEISLKEREIRVFPLP